MITTQLYPIQASTAGIQSKKHAGAPLFKGTVDDEFQARKASLESERIRREIQDTLQVLDDASHFIDGIKPIKLLQLIEELNDEREKKQALLTEYSKKNIFKRMFLRIAGKKPAVPEPIYSKNIFKRFDIPEQKQVLATLEEFAKLGLIGLPGERYYYTYDNELDPDLVYDLYRAVSLKNMGKLCLQHYQNYVNSSHVVAPPEPMPVDPVTDV